MNKDKDLTRKGQHNNRLFQKNKSAPIQSFSESGAEKDV